MVIDSFTDDKRFSQAMEQTLNKIKVEPDGLDSDPVVATALLHDGRRVSDECGKFTGSAGNPMGHQLRMAKVWDCTSRVLDDSSGTTMVNLVEDMENIGDISTLMSIISQKTV